MLPRNANVVQPKEAIVDEIRTHLRSNVAQRDALNDRKNVDIHERKSAARYFHVLSRMLKEIGQFFISVFHELPSEGHKKRHFLRNEITLPSKLTLQWAVRLQIPNLQPKQMRSVPFPACVELRHDHDEVGAFAHVARPPLGGGDGRRVQDEFLSMRVVDRRRLELFQVGAWKWNG